MNFSSHTKKGKSSTYSLLIPFQVSRVSDTHFCRFAPGPIHQESSGGKSLTTCGRFDRLGIQTPYLPHPRQTSYTCAIWPVSYKLNVFNGQLYDETSVSDT